MADAVVVLFVVAGGEGIVHTVHVLERNAVGTHRVLSANVDPVLVPDPWL